MGMVNKSNETPPPVIPPPGPHEVQHFPDYSPQTPCSSCGLKSSGAMFSCKTCGPNYYSHLHQSCAKFHQACAALPRSFVHASHPGCALSLVNVSTYPGGKFICKACSMPGVGRLLYHCARCKHDFHICCATKPLRIRHKAHPSCDLVLFFVGPYINSIGFSCSLCYRVSSNQWRYRCNSCDFDLHMNCAIDR